MRTVGSDNEDFVRRSFLEYYRPLTAFAFKIVGDLDDSKDIVQSCFAKLYEKGDNLSIHHDLKSYLFTSVRNACLNFLRKANTRSLYEKEYASQFENAAYSDKIEQTEEELKIFNAIDSLPPQCKKIFLMSRFEDRKNKDIAEELSISIRTVETQISNAIKQLRSVIHSFLSF